MCKNYLLRFFHPILRINIYCVQIKIEFNIDIHFHWLYIPKANDYPNERLDLMASCSLSFATLGDSHAHK